MSSANGSDKNEQGVHNSNNPNDGEQSQNTVDPNFSMSIKQEQNDDTMKPNDVEQSQNTEDPNSSNIIKQEENWPSDVGDDHDNDNDDEDLSDGDDLENIEEEEDDISNDPDLTDQIKRKLIYGDGPFSDDHIFWVNNRNEHVINARREIHRLKHEVSKSTKDERHSEKLTELEEKERLFVKKYIKKIKFTENPPELGPPLKMPRMYRKKDPKCAARSKLRVFINQLTRDIKFLKRCKNKYVSNMQMELKLKKRQCFEQFYVLKTPEELEFSKNHVKGIPVPFKPHITIEKPPWSDELSHSDKQRLIYTKQNYTNDHIFWTDARGAEVNKLRSMINTTKRFLQRMIQAEDHKQIASAKEAIERQELYFISKYIHKVEIDHSLPQIRPMPRDLQKKIYDNNFNQSPFRIKTCPEQKEMLLKLQDLKNKISLMDKYKNMYTPHVLNQLHNLEFEYKKKFLVAKNPDKIFPEYDMKLVSDTSKDASDNNQTNLPSQESGVKEECHLENDPKVKNSRMASDDEEMKMNDEENEDEEEIDSNQTSNNWSRWINELPSTVKEHLIYSKEPNSEDHIFWVHTPDHSVSWAKKELAQLKQQVRKTLDANQIDILKKEIKEKEDLFVRNHFNKVECDRTLPIIKPMEPRLRKALYYLRSLEVTYNIKRCPEQIEMLLDLKARKRIFTRMVRIKNMHAPSVVNELYHKEFEYQKQFCSMKNEEEIQSAMKERQERPKKISKKQMKRMKQMAKKLGKANPSFGNTTQNPSTFNRNKQASQTFSKTNNSWRQNQPGRQSRNDNFSQQSNKDGNGQMNVQMWKQPDRNWGQQMRKEQGQNYGYNQSNTYQQPWGQQNSNWNQANDFRSQGGNSTQSWGNQGGNSTQSWSNQGGNSIQSWNNRGNQHQYNNTNYNQNTFDRSARHTKPKPPGYYGQYKPY